MSFAWSFTSTMPPTGLPQNVDTHGLSGWEASLEIPPEVTIVSREMRSSSSLNVGLAGDDIYIVGTGQVVFATEMPFTVVLYHGMSLSPNPPTDLVITIGPSHPSAHNLGIPSWVEWDNGFGDTYHFET